MYANNSRKRASHVAVGEAAYWWVLNKFTTMQCAQFGSGNGIGNTVENVDDLLGMSGPEFSLSSYSDLSHQP